MCGIAGYIGLEPLQDAKLNATLPLMCRRGPDSQAHVSFHGSFHVHFLHSRLSIVDLDPRSNQPMTIGDTTIILNGEIYNYPELRSELQKKNIALHTSSDTEVLLQYYRLYGKDCVKYFEGMWAFAIYDHSKKTVFLSRDRFGEKPLWIYQTERGIYFASETRFIKALSGDRLKVNTNHLLRYMVNGHKSLYKTEESFYEGLKELPFACNMIVDEQLNTGIEKHWKPEFKRSNQSLSQNIEQTRELMLESVKLRLRADVPMAFCLSGGVDSSALVSIASKVFKYDVNTFSIIDADKRYDEEELIDETVNDTGCKSYKIRLAPTKENISRLKELVKYHDAPLATISYFVHSFLSETISQKGFKIAVSGTGSDEIFSGYYDHFILQFYGLRNDPRYPEYLQDWKQHVSGFVRHPDFSNPELYFNDPTKRDHIYLNNEEFASYMRKDFREKFTESQYDSSLLRNRMLNELLHEVVPVILHEDDLNSMYYSVENRSPFLDKKLIEHAYSIPDDQLIQKGYAKYILREAMKGILNDKVRLAREKKGFNADIRSILDFNDPGHKAFLLNDSPVFDIVDKKKIEELMSREFYTNSFKKFLFNFVNTKIFLENQE